MSSLTNIYVLRLISNKFYVGKSRNVTKRYAEHLNGVASFWTKKYKPVAIDKVIENVSPFEEDKMTKEYMSIHGINNVRGGSYVKEILDSTEMELIKKEIWGAKNLCTRCGRDSHFIKNCYAKTDIYGEYLDSSDSDASDTVWVCDFCDKEFDDGDDCMKHEKRCSKGNKCYRCGRHGHFASSCYSSFHVNGYFIK